MLPKVAMILMSLALLVSGVEQARAGSTLEGVRARGAILCGVGPSFVGFSRVDEQGVWSGFDVDLCRALAAAVLGDSQRVKFLQLSPQSQFPALNRREIDVLMRGASWTLLRDATFHIEFTGVTFYDAQGFMVRADSGINGLDDIGQHKVCVQVGTGAAYSMNDYLQRTGKTLSLLMLNSLEETKMAFFTGRCDVYADLVSTLASLRTSDALRPQEYKILGETIAREPRSPAVRDDDPDWINLVRWTLMGLLLAEQNSITSANVDQHVNDLDGEVSRLLGGTPGMGIALGLDDGWGAHVVRQVGNYGEIYERNVGHPLGLPRGLNALWTQGGLMYPLLFH